MKMFFIRHHTRSAFCIKRMVPFKPARYRLTSTVASPVHLEFDVYEPPKDYHKPPLVILHGLLGSKTNWKSLAKIISSQCERKIYSLDARNHGESPHNNQHDYFSMAADLEFFMKNQGIEQCILMGHSMGGRTAMVTALQKPSLIDRLVVVDVSPISPNPTLFKNQSSIILDLVKAMNLSSQEIISGKTLSEVRRAVDKSLARSIQDIGLRQFALTNLVEEIVDGKAKIQWRLNLQVLEESVISGMMNFPASLRGMAYSGPTLFICGGKSNYLRLEDHESVRKIFPSCQIEYVPDAGHWVHAEKPTEFLKILTPFL